MGYVEMLDDESIAEFMDRFNREGYDLREVTLSLPQLPDGVTFHGYQAQWEDDWGDECEYCFDRAQYEELAEYVRSNNRLFGGVEIGDYDDGLLFYHYPDGERLWYATIYPNWVPMFVIGPDWGWFEVGTDRGAETR